MTKLFTDTKTLPGADLGPENPLPALNTLRSVHDLPVRPEIPEDMKRNIRYGMRANPLPYTLQDGYSREKYEKSVKTIVLENDHIKATFLPEYGGRLWSLFDKNEERDLVYENPVFQPANLAIRNAWLSGGVEWNIGLRGHSPFTCSDVFAARVDGENDVPVLRMYEFERIRQVPYSIDFILPSDSRLLLVYVRIVNPHDHEVPMYWWSNIAYPEARDTRVVVPAEKAFHFAYGQGGLQLRDIPVNDGVDVTYSTNLGHSADFFFDIPKEDRKWVAAIDSSGAGLFQASTDILQGRKLFLWGSGPGGNAWQSFLSEPGAPYLEIQAGLAHTQLEHLPMPAGAEWNWLEAYGYVKVDPDAVHRGSWQDAYGAVGDQVGRLLPRSELESSHESARKRAEDPIKEILHTGSGWGSLETAFRKQQGSAPLTGDEIDYGTDVGPAQEQWLNLLEDGSFPEPNPIDEPRGYEVEVKWQGLLEEYVAKNPKNWYALLHLGLMYFERDDLGKAQATWEASAIATQNPWALRNLAALAVLREDTEGAVAYYRQAYGLLDTCKPLTVEYGASLLKAGMANEWIEVFDALAEDTKAMGRFQLLYAEGLLESGRLDEALAVVESEPEVTDLREGENSLTEIWYRIQERKVVANGEVPEGDLREYVQDRFPPPANIDFRMKTKPQTE